LDSLAGRDDVALSEFVLSEFYLHLRNPAVLVQPLDAKEAVEVVQELSKTSSLAGRWFSSA